MEAMILKPHTEHPIWSGERLRSEYNIACDKAIGEAFNMSTLPMRESIIASGKDIGKTLTEVLRENPSYTLNHSVSNGELNLLFKLIDTSDKLSVQVHPDDSYAAAKENQLGKTESWLVLFAKPEAFIYLGLNGDYARETVKQAIQNNTVETLLNKIYVKAGDYFYIPSGTIHALGAGITIAEIQQSSMVTYRLYDFDRKDKNGNPRELHIEKSLDVISYEKTNLDSLRHNATVPMRNEFFVVDSEEYFEVLICDITKSVAYGYEDFSLLTIIDGLGELTFSGGKLQLAKGQSVFIPANLKVMISGQMRTIIDRIPIQK